MGKDMERGEEKMGRKERMRRWGGKMRRERWGGKMKRGRWEKR